MATDLRVLPQLPTAKRWPWVAGAFTVAAASASVAIRDPHVGGSFGLCPSVALFGVYCPGCGSLRATHDFLTGSPVEALGHNVLLPLALLWLVWWWAAGAARAFNPTLDSVTGKVQRALVAGPPQSVFVTVSFVVVSFGFAVVRNLPGSPLAP